MLNLKKKIPKYNFKKPPNWNTYIPQYICWSFIEANGICRKKSFFDKDQHLDPRPYKQTI